MAIEKHDTTENTLVPVSEKYTLTIKEAASYFNIGTKKMRRLAEDNRGRFAVFSGNRYLIIRPQFEKFISASSESPLYCYFPLLLLLLYLASWYMPFQTSDQMQVLFLI